MPRAGPALVSVVMVTVAVCSPSPSQAPSWLVSLLGLHGGHQEGCGGGAGETKAASPGRKLEVPRNLRRADPTKPYTPRGHSPLVFFPAVSPAPTVLPDTGLVLNATVLNEQMSKQMNE